MVTELDLLRRALRSYILRVGGPVLVAYAAEARARSMRGADERLRATVSAMKLRALLDDTDRNILDLACGAEPDAGQARVLEVGRQWLAGAGRARA